ncbi:MAG: CdaR family protein [Sulfobacillus sp.]|nr:CdaR family protein [Sulfobacillus sp.]
MMDRLLENDTVLKILSVIAAIFLWFQAGPLQTQPINHEIGPIPVGFPTPNPHLTVISIQPSTVTVTVKGPPAAFTGTAASDVYAIVNLAGLTKSGTYSLKVVASVPPNTSLVSVSPNRVIVTVARLGASRAPVAIRTSGTLAPGYQLTGTDTAIKSATISGPVNDLNQVRQVVGTLVLNGQTSSFQSPVVLEPVNAAGRLVPHVEVNPPTVTVNATVQAIPPQKVLPVVGQYTGQPAPGYKITQIAVYPATVTVTGPSSILNGLTHLNTPAISVAGATGTVSKTVAVTLPNGVALVNSGTVTVTVTIQHQG